jgi:hypothetical protein
MLKFKKIVIGIDQSYTRTGISIAADGKLKMVKSFNLKGLKSKTEKREFIKNKVGDIIDFCFSRSKNVIIIVERIRLFTGGSNKNKGFLAMPYIKSTAALITIIVDVAYNRGVNVYSVDTRSWKSKIIGTSRRKGGNTKVLTLEYVKKLGFDIGKDDDAADSACIALYGFLPENQQKLKKED